MTIAKLKLGTSTLVLVAGLGLLTATGAQAVPVNGTGLVSPEVIFGSGNANGGFTGQTVDNVEVALRAKQRYPAANIFNYDGVNGYTFDSSVLNTNPANRSVFNFEWSINVNADGNFGGSVSSYDYNMSIDQDASAATNFVTFFDPINAMYADHAMGDNTTLNGGGAKAVDAAGYSALLSTSTVAQNSWNLGFGFSGDPDLPGIYDIQFNVFAKGTSDLIASSYIQVTVLPLPAVPVPAALPLLVTGLGGLALFGRRRKAART